MHRNVKFIIQKKTGMLHVTTFKYSLHKFSDTILH